MSTPPPRPSSLATGWKIAIGLSAALTLYVAAFFAVTYEQTHATARRAQSEIEKRLDELRADHEPVTAEDLAKLYPDPPPDQDAKILLAPAIAALKTPTDEEYKIPLWGGADLPSGTNALLPEMRASIEAVLQKNRPALDAIPWDKIANARLVWSFAHGLTNGMPYSLTAHGRLARLFYLKAAMEAADGDGDEAVQNLCRGLTLAHLCGHEVILTHLSSRFAEMSFCRTLQWVVNHTTVSDDGLAALDHALTSENQEALVKIYVNERCENISMMEDMKKTRDRLSFSPGSPADVLLGVSRRIYRDDDFLDMLNAKARQIAALKLPARECFTEFERIREEYRKPSGKMSFAASFAGIGNDFKELPEDERNMIARIRVTRVAVEIERWRNAHAGRLPDSLGQLVPEYTAAVPLDVFDSNPLRYKKTAQGFIVYSIGPAFTDDGVKDATDTDAIAKHFEINFRALR